jgi:hypothetical protein
VSDSPGDGSRIGQRTQLALEECTKQVRWYERHSRADWWLYRTFQVAVVVLSGSTPLLLLFTNIPKGLQALPAATAAVVAAVAGAFHWHEDAVRWATTRELLKSELRQFNARADQYPAGLSDEEALDRFVTRTESLITRELESWRLVEEPRHDHDAAAQAKSKGS